MKNNLGMNTRDLDKQILFQEKNKNKLFYCSCPIHLNEKNEKTLIDGSYFNRLNENSIQSMCSEGKKWLDQFQQNKLRRLCLTFISFIDENSKILELKDYKNFNFNNKKINIILNNINNILKTEGNNFINNKNTENFLILLNNLYKKLLCKNIGIYTHLEHNDLMELDSYINSINNDFLEQNKKITHKYLNNNYYILDSFTKNFNKNEKKFINVKNIGYNLSKTQELYFFNDKENEFIKTPFKVPLHNTKNKSVNSSNDRLIKNFSFEGNEKEANSRIKELRLLYSSKEYDIDHIFPLSLGGLHTPKNLEPLEKKTNIRKKDNLTFEVYQKIKDDNYRDNYLSSYVIEEFKHFKEKVKNDKELFEKNIKNFQTEVKIIKNNYIKKFFSMEKNEQLKKLSKFYNGKNSNNIEKLLERIKKHHKDKYEIN